MMPSGELMICRLPAKFQKKIWIKRGDYVIVTLHTEVAEGRGVWGCGCVSE